MSNDKMREEFEAWALARFINSDTMKPLQRSAVDSDGYHYPVLETAWAAWQASREVLVIELPARIGYEHRYGDIAMSLMDQDQDPSADESFGLVRAIEVLEAIEAAGLKVKS